MMIEENEIFSYIDRIVSDIGTAENAVIPILHSIQKKFNYLPEIALRRVCETTQITPASITGVSTFYTQFRLTPVGEHVINICCGTACHVKGAELVLDAFARELKITAHYDTDPDGLFTLQRVSCLGCCTLAPVIQIDDVTYGHVKAIKVSNILQDFISGQSDSGEHKTSDETTLVDAGEIRIGLGSCCIAGGSSKVKQALESSLVETGIQTSVKRVGCVGMCHRTPLLEVHPPNQKPILYDKIQPDDVKRILLRHYKPKSLKKRLANATIGFLEDLLYKDQSNGIDHHSFNTRDPQVESFLGRQVHIATEHSGELDPMSLQEYRSGNGFKALDSCLSETSPEAIIDQIESSGLRGRGGAGFPTGKKWDIARKSADTKKYIICNGDEGDPGAFMDRMILESFPYRVIEGMIIAAFAVGAYEGIFYIRAEYPLAVERVRYAIKECENAGLLGDNILGSGFSLKLTIMEGAGAFVCGEETALIASIEGRRGTPSFRPPYPAHKGLWGHSTLVNNCETYATVPWILRQGAEAFSNLGTDKSKGTKVFSLAGKIARGGLIEVPMGITIREIVEEIGGGIEHGRQFKAVQIGGPSGGCIPAKLADTK
ncbi:NAD(P)H-dependent oxidoreductase subunit E, partial [candidate division KSB1 bacterium]